MSRNLVIVPAGEESLHENISRDRDFDLWVFYWGSDDSVARRYEGSADLLVRAKGYKWELLRQHRKLLDEKRPTYADGYVLYLDDDIAMNGGTAAVSELFETARTVNADFAQPAIANGNLSWPSTARIPGAVCHAVNVVENMMPVFRGGILYDILLPALHALPHVRLAWYLEFFFQRFAEAYYRRPVRSFVLDNISAEHTRKPGEGSASVQGGWDEAFLVPGLAACVPATLAVFDEMSRAKEYRFPWAEVDMNEVRRRMSRIRAARKLSDTMEKLSDRIKRPWTR